MDLEESGGRVRVKKLLVRTRAKKDGGKGYAFDDPKTKRARAVSFGPGAAKALRTHHARQNEERLRFGPAYAGTGLVFTEEWGGLLAMWKSLRLLHDLASRIGIEKHFGFSELRHTAATLSFAEGAREARRYRRCWGTPE